MSDSQVAGFVEENTACRSSDVIYILKIIIEIIWNYQNSNYTPLIFCSGLNINTHTKINPTWSVFLAPRGLSLWQVHTLPYSIYVVQRKKKKKKVVWLSFSISLYVLLTKWNEQTHCPNMLHHTERVGLSYRINKGRRGGGIGSPLE